MFGNKYTSKWLRCSFASCDEKEKDSIMSSTIHTLAWHNNYVGSCVWRDAESSVASLKPDQILSSDETECSDGLDLWPSPHVGCWANTEPPHSLPGSHSATQPAEEERRLWWPGRPVTLAELQVAGRQAGGLWCRPLVILLELFLPLIWSAMVGRDARCPRCGRGRSTRRSNVRGVLTPRLSGASGQQPNWNAYLMTDGHERAGGPKGANSN